MHFEFKNNCDLKNYIHRWYECNIENPKEPTEKLMEQTKNSAKVAGYKMNIQK